MSDLDVLTTALDQFEELVTAIGPDDVEAPTPCPDWTVRQLGEHVIGSIANFAKVVAGGEVDWSAARSVEGELVPAYREAKSDLLAAWDRADAENVGQPPTWQCAELAVHTWDLATALHRSTSDLDQEVAEAGLAFMQGALKDEMRQEAFGPAQEPPEDADAYGRIAAFAGRGPWEVN